MTTQRNDGLLARMTAFSRRFDLLPPGTTVLCALSGGRDSMALLEALRELAQPWELTVLAAHYDHRLRGGESRRDADFVTAWCRERRVPLTLGQGDVAARAGEEKRGVEETARAMRYAFLEETAQRVGADVVATAHNAEDNVETVLLHLVRGAGLDGLAGIPPRRGRFIRPLLDTSRRLIDEYLARRGVPYVEDSTNAQVQYTRNRLRQEVLPVLRQINPNLPQTLSDNLIHLREDRDFLRRLAQEAVEGASRTGRGISLPAAALADQPHPIAARGVRLLLEELGCFQVSAAQLDGILALAGGGLPSGRFSFQGLTVWRDYDTLTFTLHPAEPLPVSVRTLPGPGRYVLENGWTVALREERAGKTQGPFRCFLRLDAAAFPLTVRPRRTGDALRLPGRPVKPLKKWYIDEKIPRRFRDSLPVLEDENGILMAAGLGPQADRIAGAGELALEITVSPPQ